jgi:hypothetical protein
VSGLVVEEPCSNRAYCVFALAGTSSSLVISHYIPDVEVVWLGRQLDVWEILLKLGLRLQIQQYRSG